MTEKTEVTLSGKSSEKPIVVERKYYLYIPMPVVKNWFRTRGNYAMVKFNSTVTPEQMSRAYTSPSSSTLDMDLVNHLKTLGIGEAILVPFDTSVTERALKVAVGKAATAANRKLEWKKIDEGYVVRVKLILNSNSQNGQVATTEEAVETPTEEAAASGRNRR